jgi:hypothetical protein
MDTYYGNITPCGGHLLNKCTMVNRYASQHFFLQIAWPVSITDVLNLPDFSTESARVFYVFIFVPIKTNIARYRIAKRHCICCTRTHSSKAS